ncbi:MAG TPA: NAD(P)H-hydrate dehydratase [Terracidiphilus sp.]|nr:NAD(P)H-hydrate dehydratase [Terracidiphilus sp.]
MVDRSHGEKSGYHVAMHVLSAAEMQACDRATAERFGVPSLQLMRAAAGAVADFAQRNFPHARQVTTLCGRGNNGGDGMMAARLLAAAGLEVTTILLGTADGLKGDAAAAWRELADSPHGPIHIITTADELKMHTQELAVDLILDAVVGTGFKPPLTGLALAAAEWVRGSQAPILAVDLPSGWPADATAATVDGAVFPADAVVTFTAPQPAHVFGQLTRQWDQPIIVAPIGSPEAAMESDLQLDWAGAAHRLVEKRRAATANKGDFGHVLVVGGSLGLVGGKAGAPAMTALAALRGGAGLVTAAVPAPALRLVATVAQELMTWPLEETATGQISEANLAPGIVTAITAGKTVLAIGPGLGQGMEVARFTLGLLQATRVPAVIDADALNTLAAHPGALAEIAKDRFVAVTPHPGEMARLAGITTAEVQANRLDVARGFARINGVTVVLKGWRTLIAHADGRVAVNTTGNPGMAKGGSGDVLTGLVAGLLAQFPSEPEAAVEAAVHLHGLAADLTVRAEEEHTLLATDSLRLLARAFRFRSSGQSGYVWLQGLPGDMVPAIRAREAAE